MAGTSGAAVQTQIGDGPAHYLLSERAKQLEAVQSGSVPRACAPTRGHVDRGDVPTAPRVRHGRLAPLGRMGWQRPRRNRRHISHPVPSGTRPINPQVTRRGRWLKHDLPSQTAISHDLIRGRLGVRFARSDVPCHAQTILNVEAERLVESTYSHGTTPK